MLYYWKIHFNNDQEALMAHTLVLLGTDTKFGDRDGYDKAETLGYVSTLICVDSTDPFPTDKITQYRNSNVAVVDGPTTLGSEVGDRIARGVLAILEAISRGETKINIIAHSRGAVEAILVAHELERIQKLLKNPSVDPAILTKSECQYTTAAMNELHKVAFSQLEFNKISQYFDLIELALLTIDPVPGGNYMGITRLASLAWRDPRFYRVPKIVKEYEQYIYENERTRCFKCIVPKSDSPETTTFKLCSLPGHHGTGSGNLKSQQRQDVPQGTAEHVQELVIVKIIDFLTRNGVKIIPKLANDDPFAELMVQIRLTHEKEFKPLYLDLYNKIVVNREAYLFFNKTSYPTLGQEQALLRMICKVVDQRIVHYQAHNDTYLESIVPPVPGGHFLNYEHARIHLNNELGFEYSSSLNQTIEAAIGKLLKICEHTEKLKNLKSKPQQSDLSSSFMLDKVAPTLDSKEGFDLLLDALGMLIEEVRRPYLQDEFIDAKLRGDVYEVVGTVFIRFNQFVAENSENELAKIILNTLNSNLVTTLETKRNTLFAQYQVPLQVKIEQIETKLAEIKQQGEADGQLLTKLEKFLQEAKLLFNLKSSDVKLVIEEHFNVLDQTQAQTAVGMQTLDLAKLLLNEALEDSLNYDGENMMREFIKSHHQLEKLRSDIPNFKKLYADFDYDKLARELNEKRNHLIDLAVQNIVREGLNLENSTIKDLFIGNETLYREIQLKLVELGGNNLVAEDPLNPRMHLEQQEASQLQEETQEEDLPPEDVFDKKFRVHREQFHTLITALDEFSSYCSTSDDSTVSLYQAFVQELKTDFDEVGHNFFKNVENTDKVALKTSFEIFKSSCERLSQKAEKNFKHNTGLWSYVKPILTGFLGVVIAIAVSLLTLGIATYHVAKNERLRSKYIDTFFKSESGSIQDAKNKWATYAVKQKLFGQEILTCNGLVNEIEEIMNTKLCS